jgi:aspartyl-tRNA(Asn)/glutamyl-tRNA(Gln) amidotransferase subunit A
LLLGRIQKAQLELNAFSELLEDTALADAQKSDQRTKAAGRLSPLDGVCLAVKDLFDIQEVETTGGSRAYQGRFPEKDATVVRLLRQAGAIIIGKTNTDELGLGACTNTSFLGATKNPWDLTRVPGGSSGGSAAAVAAGLVHGALGSDTGGSVRDPAAMCGISAMKPTFGLVSRAGMLAFSRSLDHAGVLARSAEDCALLLSRLVGQDKEDPDTIESHTSEFQSIQNPNLGGLRIAIVPSLVEGSHDPVVSNFDNSVSLLKDLGAEIGEAEIFHELKLSHPLVNPEFAEAHRTAFDRHPEKFGERVRKHLRKGTETKPEAYQLAVKNRQEIENTVTNRMREWDAVICPTAPAAAERIGDQDSVGFRTRNTLWFNLSRQPAIAIPNGFTADRLPTSLMIAGRKYEDSVVLKIARALQTRTDFHLQQPPEIPCSA